MRFKWFQRTIEEEGHEVRISRFCNGDVVPQDDHDYRVLEEAQLSASMDPIFQTPDFCGLQDGPWDMCIGNIPAVSVSPIVTPYWPYIGRTMNGYDPSDPFGIRSQWTLYDPSIFLHGFRMPMAGIDPRQYGVSTGNSKWDRMDDKEFDRAFRRRIMALVIFYTAVFGLVIWWLFSGRPDIWELLGSLFGSTLRW